MEASLIYLMTGAVAGTTAGLLGVGGGLIIVPALALYFSHTQFAAQYPMHMAIGTSLATIVVTGLSSVLAHHRHGAVNWQVVMRLAPGLVFGAVTGVVLADRLATGSLQGLFGWFELAVAAQLGLGRQPLVHRALPGTPGLSVVGWGIGTVSSLLGIGGGTLTVPFLLWCGIPIRRAVAVSAACGVPIAAAGAAGFATAGGGVSGLPAFTTGYIYWPAFAGIAVTSVLFAPLGAHLAHRLPRDRLRRIFAGFLALVGLRMLLG